MAQDEFVARAIADQLTPGWDKIAVNRADLRRRALLSEADINDLTQDDLRDVARVAIDAVELWGSR